MDSFESKWAPSPFKDVPTPVENDLRREAAREGTACSSNARTERSAIPPPGKLAAEMENATEELRLLRADMQRHMQESLDGPVSSLKARNGRAAVDGQPREYVGMSRLERPAVDGQPREHVSMPHVDRGENSLPRDATMPPLKQHADRVGPNLRAVPSVHFSSLSSAAQPDRVASPPRVLPGQSSLVSAAAPGHAGSPPRVSPMQFSSLASAAVPDRKDSPPRVSPMQFSSLASAAVPDRKASPLRTPLGQFSSLASAAVPGDRGSSPVRPPAGQFSYLASAAATDRGGSPLRASPGHFSSLASALNSRSQFTHRPSSPLIPELHRRGENNYTRVTLSSPSTSVMMPPHSHPVAEATSAGRIHDFIPSSRLPLSRAGDTACAYGTGGDNATAGYTYPRSGDDNETRSLRAEVDTLLKVNAALQAEVEQVNMRDSRNDATHWETQCRALQEKVQQLEQEGLHARTAHVEKLEEQVDLLGSLLRKTRTEHEEQITEQAQLCAAAVEKTAALEADRDQAYSEQQTLMADLQRSHADNVEAQRNLCAKAVEWESRLKEFETHKTNLEQQAREEKVLLEEERVALDAAKRSLEEAQQAVDVDRKAIDDIVGRERVRAAESGDVAAKCEEENRLLLAEVERYRDEIVLAKEAIRRSPKWEKVQVLESLQQHERQNAELQNVNNMLRMELEQALERNKELANDVSTACEFKKLTSTKAHKKVALEVEELREWKTKALISMRETESELEILRTKYKKQLANTHKLQKKLGLEESSPAIEDCNTSHAQDFSTLRKSTLRDAEVHAESNGMENHVVESMHSRADRRGHTTGGREMETSVHSQIRGDSTPLRSRNGREIETGMRSRGSRGDMSVPRTRNGSVGREHEGSLLRGSRSNGNVGREHNQSNGNASREHEGSLLRASRSNGSLTMATRRKKSVESMMSNSMHTRDNSRISLEGPKRRPRAKSIPKRIVIERPFR